MRKLASIQRINGVYPIEGKDRIMQYGIGGWLVIDQVGKYAVGDLVIYLEVDSWVPNALAPFLTKKGDPRVFEGVPGERLKTIKMGGALSQGLLLPIPPEFADPTQFVEDLDVTELLGILKWERSPEFIAANAKGDFPYFLRKTDQERVQNVKRVNEVVRRSYEVSEKIEGQSFTAFIRRDDDDAKEFGICSRNQQLKMDEPSTWLTTYESHGLEEKLLRASAIWGANLAFQGEQVGPGIEGNIYGFNAVHLYVFDVWDIDAQRYLLPTERRKLLDEVGVEGVPYVGEMVFPDPDVVSEADQESTAWMDGEQFRGLDMRSIQQTLLSVAYRCSDLAPVVSEGLVFKSNTDDYSFKAISPEYSLLEKLPTPWTSDSSCTSE